RPLHARIAVAVDVRIAARRAEDGAPALQDPAHVAPLERSDVAVHQPVPAVQDPDHLDAVRRHGAADDGADDGVQPGAVAAGREDAVEHVALSTHTYASH